MIIKMHEEEVRKNSLRAWMLAARPKTLAGAAVPVLIGAALAVNDSAWSPQWMPMMLCFLFAFIMQIDANFVNDYFDFVRGNDDETRLGPKRACAEGWISPRAMRYALVVTTVLGCFVGLPLVFYGGWTMVAVGALCVVFCFLYTTYLSYKGLGDLLVLVFFGLVPVCLTYYLSLPAGHQTVTLEALLASVACGLVIDLLLTINNYRDIDNDRNAGKITVAVRLGASRTRRLYYYLGFTACIIDCVFCFYGHDLAFFLTGIFLWLHVNTYQEMMRINKGRGLNKVLGLTARNMFVYGLCVAVGVLLS